jgi:lipid-binding SYLF domain-containing protein
MLIKATGCTGKGRALGINPLRLLIVMVFGALIAVLSLPVWADDATDARVIVEKAKITAEGFWRDPKIDPTWRDLLRDAKGVLIVPQIVKGGFILGGSGGSGVLLARDKRKGRWNGPAFYTIGGVSFGLLAGAEVAETVIVVRTERGITRLLSTGAKLGADVSIAAGPVGGGMGAGNIVADLVVLSRAKGLYGGLSLEGSLVNVRDSLNRAYYGRSVTPTDILILGSVRNPQADGLISAVKRLTGGT